MASWPPYKIVQLTLISRKIKDVLSKLPSFKYKCALYKKIKATYDNVALRIPLKLDIRTKIVDFDKHISYNDRTINTLKYIHNSNLPKLRINLCTKSTPIVIKEFTIKSRFKKWDL